MATRDAAATDKHDFRTLGNHDPGDIESQPLCAARYDCDFAFKAHFMTSVSSATRVMVAISAMLFNEA
ncbi:hypothetical protein D3C81_1175950 [compost metagenome]